jgi:hypothetical protein
VAWRLALEPTAHVAAGATGVARLAAVAIAATVVTAAAAILALRARRKLDEEVDLARLHGLAGYGLALGELHDAHAAHVLELATDGVQRRDEVGQPIAGEVERGADRRDVLGRGGGSLGRRLTLDGRRGLGRRGGRRGLTKLGGVAECISGIFGYGSHAAPPKGPRV